MSSEGGRVGVGPGGEPVVGGLDLVPLRRGSSKWDVVLKARVAYGLHGGGEEGVRAAARLVGVTAAVVRGWRSKRLPTGEESWEAVAAEMAQVPAKDLQSLATGLGEAEERRVTLGAARAVMGRVIEAMEVGEVLYDRPPQWVNGEEVARNVVDVLYTEEGRKVDVGRLRPHSLDEASRIMERMGRLSEGQWARIMLLQGEGGASQAEVDAKVGEVLRVAAKVLGGEAFGRLVTALQEGSVEGAGGGVVPYGLVVEEGEFEVLGEQGGAGTTDGKG